MSVKHWIWLSSLPRNLRNKLYDEFADAERAYYAEESGYREAKGITEGEIRLLRNKSLSEAERIAVDCGEKGVGILTIQDAAYPARLRHIYDPPLVLYTLGRLPDIDGAAAIAVAGTRRASPYGIKMSRKLGYEITRGGGLIVSGLAAGVDSAAAKGAIEAGGSCVGVLGTAIDVVYPSFNGRLFADVEAVGAIVSEYPPGAPKEPGTFPARNRILSGLSVGVVIIEAPKGSGALITAARALEQGRDVFAVPGNADMDNCRGSNALIKEGARAVTSGRDVLSEYERLYQLKPKDAPRGGKRGARESVEKRTASEANTEDFVKFREPSPKKVIDKAEDREYIDLGKQLENVSETGLKLIAAMTRPSMHIDDIIERTGLGASEVLSEMTVLQIEGYVLAESGRRFSLNIKRG